MVKYVIIEVISDICSHCQEPISTSDAAFYLDRMDLVVIDGKEYKHGSILCMNCWEKKGNG